MKKTSKNNDFLNDVRNELSPKVYDVVIDLVNEDREDLAKEIIKINYLLDYTSRCLKAKDKREAKDSIERVKLRIDNILKDGFSIDYIVYLYEGIRKKVK